MPIKPYSVGWLNNFATDCLKENPIVEESAPAAIAPIAALFVNICFCHEDKMSTVLPTILTSVSVLTTLFSR